VRARTKLTLSYAAFLLGVAAALVVVFVSVLNFVPVGNLSGDGGSFVPDREDLAAALWPRLIVAVLFLIPLGSLAGWFLAGRMIAPLHRVHTVARQVSTGSLDSRVHLSGPHDELRELADTFDAMLDRLQASFGEHQRFAANASHELRTPHAVTRSLLEVALSDPTAHRSAADEKLLHRLAQTNRRSEQLIEALLALSHLDARHLPAPRPVDLAEVTRAVLLEARPEAARRGLQMSTQLGEGDFDGEETLVRQLVSNLVDNALRHNSGAGGIVQVSTTTREDDSVELVVGNTGAQLGVADVSHLVKPFVRGSGRTGTAHGDDETPGNGLGLAIVARIARVHGADLRLAARPGGGMDVTVVFPAPRTPPRS
jgi:two-component system sensor histidine kinase VanS